MRVFVTGASGFIGSHVVRRLHRAGHQVAVLIRPASSLWRLRELVDAVQCFSGDLDSLAFLETPLREWRPEACIHLAWYAEPGKYWESKANVASLKGSLDLLDVLSRTSCSHVVIAGTCAEYDMEAGDFRESAPVRPLSLYAAAKLSLSLVAQQLALQQGFTLAWARLFYLYGPYEDARRLVPALIRSLMGGESFRTTAGDQVRDYLHVDDVADAVCCLAEHRAAGIFNVCSGREVTLRHLIQTVGELLERSELIRFGALPTPAKEPRFICGNNRRLTTELGWQPRYGLREGLADTVAWWKQNATIARVATN